MSEGTLTSFGKFSAHAKTILLAAQRYAEGMRLSLGSEHMLMACMVTPDTDAYQVLRKIPITPDQLRLALAMNPPKRVEGDGMRQEAKSVLERAAFQAAVLGMEEITPECILWSLVSDTDCVAHRLITQLGVEPKSIRKSLEHLFLEQSQLEHLPHDIEILGVVGPDVTADQGEKADEHHHHHHDEPLTGEDAEESDTPILDEYAVDLTALAASDAFDPLIGRDVELERLVHILGRKTKNNPLLLGEPGVGKTAIVEGLAMRIVARSVPAYLQGARVLSLELSSLIAGTMYRGQFEERLRRLVAELTEQEDTILFIDEIHTLVGAGSAEGSLDAANILKPMLAKGTLRLIGATTHAEYQKYIEKDAALARRLQPIPVSEPTEQETLQILRGLAPRYAAYHGVTVDDALLEEIVRLAGRYLPDRHFPDKAIDLIDEAASARKSVRPARGSIRPSRFELERKLKELRSQKTYELKRGNFERAAYLRNEEVRLRLEAGRLAKTRVERSGKKTALSIDDVRLVVSRWTSIPAERLALAERRALLELEDRLTKRVIGQAEPLKTLSAAIRRARSGVRPTNRPVGAFLLVGPTGVGKTETARAIAEEAFGDPRALIKLDMSEYMEKHQAARLVGAPPGYVGHENSSPILEEIRRRPHRVLLFDEVEKAHPDVMNLLLQILEDGVLTDGKGRSVSFRETLILLTSNIGGELWSSQGNLGFASQDAAGTAWWQSPLQDRLKEHFRPEFLNRLDGVLTYHPLSTEQLATILNLELEKLVRRVALEHIALSTSPRLTAELMRRVTNSKQGARSIRRLVESEVATVLADALLRWPNTREFVIDSAQQGIVVRRAQAKALDHDRRQPVRTA